MKYILLFVILCLPVKNFTGKVVAVIDGDTIEVLKDGKSVRIRLNGVDCPEKTQAFGSSAKQFTSNLVFGKAVEVREKELDRYGRTIADVYIDGVWLNKALIEAGMAWHYKRYSDDKQLSEAETMARTSRVGLWGDNTPVAPWDFRHPPK
jgi:micrococcal nuclease